MKQLQKLKLNNTTPTHFVRTPEKGGRSITFGDEKRFLQLPYTIIVIENKYSGVCCAVLRS